VLSSLAARHGITKSDLLATDSSTNPAVKAAMAETSILSETKIYLTDNGVDLSSFASSSKSDTVIIVKNFPYGTTKDELVLLFGGPDIVKRLLLPPAGTIAFIEFHDAGQSRSTFKRLAYRRFKDTPLYLEKAPHGIFQLNLPTKISTQNKSNEVLTTSDLEEPSATLYVKNIDFTTTQAGLTAAFKNFPGFRLATLKTKPPNAKGEKFSMGFGFVTFQSKELATMAINANIILDSRKLEIKFARQDSEIEVLAPQKVTSTTTKKIIVKNLAFNVNKHDLRELFGYPPGPGCSGLTIVRTDIFNL
jgi:multiple RNA-binding domain-containing protein 1